MGHTLSTLLGHCISVLARTGTWDSGPSNSHHIGLEWVWMDVEKGQGSWESWIGESLGEEGARESTELDFKDQLKQCGCRIVLRTQGDWWRLVEMIFCAVRPACQDTPGQSGLSLESCWATESPRDLNSVEPVEGFVEMFQGQSHTVPFPQSSPLILSVIPGAWVIS